MAGKIHWRRLYLEMKKRQANTLDSLIGWQGVAHDRMFRCEQLIRRIENISPFEVEYVDETWLHVHCSFGMVSLHLKPSQFSNLISFLEKAAKMTVSGDEIEVVSFQFGSSSEVMVELESGFDHANIHIQVNGMVAILGMAKSDIVPMCEALKSGKSFSPTQDIRKVL